MGNRATVRLTGYFSDEDVYLYTHWGADALPATVADALARGEPRWDDPAYLARIIFDEMTAEAEDGTLTGHGIMPSPPGDAWLQVTVDTDAQEARVIDKYDPSNNATLSFDDFIERYGV